MDISWLIGRNPTRTLVRGLLLATLTGLIFYFWLRLGSAQGISMEPNYHDGSLYLIHRPHYRIWEPQRGDVVAVPMLGSWRHFKLKRILGLPGERVAFSAGSLQIDDVALAEPWIEETGDWTMPVIQLASNEYFVAGDNRRIPIDQNWKDRVKRSKLYGKVFP